ncbi:MAG: 16S rRNA (cytosine(1402)-N(4))-methyltransferase, partial [Dehalococcoidia bacterium]|nr:16S rRNA (cytosine(1402)-N(4))-methyltransferase [Dehalococcoidia bacterium]
MSLTMSLPIHIPVLLSEAVEGLQAQPGGCFVDCTVGLGGHAATILEKISPSGRLLGIDADFEAIGAAQTKLSDYGKAVTLVN